MFDFLNGPYVLRRSPYDPFIIKPSKMVHILIGPYVLRRSTYDPIIIKSRNMIHILIGPYVQRRSTYDPIIIKSRKMIHILFKHVNVEFQRGNQIFKPIIIVKHIFLRGPRVNYGLTIRNFGSMVWIYKIYVHTEFHYDTNVFKPFISVHMRISKGTFKWGLESNVIRLSLNFTL